MNGIYAFLLGILAIVGAFIFGKTKGTSETKTKISGQVVIEQQKAQKAEKEKDLALETAQIVSDTTAENHTLNQFFDEFESKVQEAKRDQNPALAIAAAQSLAQNANNWKERNLK